MGPSRPFRFWGFKHLLIFLWRVQGFFDFFCGYIIRCTWIWHDKNRENSLLFYCLVSMIWFTIATNFPWKLLRTYLKKHENTKSGSLFSSSGHLGSDTPQQQKRGVFLYPKIGGSGRAQKGWDTCGGANGCHQLWRTWNQRHRKPNFLEDCARISTTDWEKTVWEWGGSMMKLNEPSHCLEVLFFCIMCNYSMLYP